MSICGQEVDSGYSIWTVSQAYTSQSQRLTLQFQILVVASEFASLICMCSICHCDELGCKPPLDTRSQVHELS